MSKTNLTIPADFPILLKEIKNRIQQAQTRAMLAVNAELVQLYWDIGRIIAARQQQEGWGAAVIPRLSRELLNELPEVKGFSERNLDRMIAFYRIYSDPAEFSPLPVAKLDRTAVAAQAVAKRKAAEKVPQPAAQMPDAPIVQQAIAQLPDSLLWSIPWSHNVLLMEKVKDRTIRLWYMQQTLTNGCQDRNHIVAEYSLRGVDKPIGISEYEMTRALPPNLKSALPTVEEIEAELADSASVHPSKPPALPAPKKRKASKPSKPTKKKQPYKDPEE
jgi:predicted nuclease of restriction endonuclease-like (RecB) superfamily